MKVQRRIHPLLLVVQIVLVLLLVVRCHSNKETTDSSKQKDSAFVFTTPKVLDMESCIDAHFEFHPDELILKDSTGLLSLSDIADDVEYVLLKASNGKQEIYFDRVPHIFLSQNYIFVQLDDNVVQYDRQGNLIRTIGRQGAGPGEYNWVFEMAVDELQKKLFVSCSGKINVYDFEGKFIRAIKSTYDDKFIPLDSNYFAAEVPNLWHDVKDRLVILDKEGKVEKRFPRHRLFPHTDFVLVSSEDTKVPRLSRFGDVVYFNERYNDTIFEIKNKELQMRYFMDWGKYAMKMEYFYERKKYDLKFKECLWIRLFEADRFAVMPSSRFALTLVYDKKTDQLRAAFPPSFTSEGDSIFRKYFHQERRGFYNDIDGGLVQDVKNMSLDCKYILSFYPAYDVKEFLEETGYQEHVLYPEKQKKLKALIETIDDDKHNMLIMMSKLKQ
ncbi:MAG TPA: 6-bladed beta-propeller [Bacteroidales bacterium]